MFNSKSPFFHCPLVELQLSKRNLDLAWLSTAPSITTYRVNLLQTTTERYKNDIKSLLEERYENPPKIYTLSNIPEVLCIGTLPISQTVNPSVEEHREVIVDSCCGAALLRGAHIYAVGVLAMESGTKLHDMVNVYADLTGKCKKGTNVRFESNKKMYIGQGRVLMQRYQLFTGPQPKAGVAVEMLNTISGVPSIGDLSSFKALLQNLPSIVCVRVLNPQKNETILDMCAAPGNKTTHIAELMQDEGLIVALDKTFNRTTLIEEKIKKYKLNSINAFTYDATKAVDIKLNSRSSNDIKPPFKPETFDRILLDAPCSALGNRPILAVKATTKMLDSYPRIQRKLITNAVALLKPGGCLVYSTCSVTISENEEIVAWALTKHLELELEEAIPILGSKAWPCQGLSERQRSMLQRFCCDTKQYDTVGFFIAKFVKKRK
uniref:SAM-dependent MTase RsmB/NOP-type domain-containing protein n=1 Tax=Glossina brevipalpis TaxID=37001 RepID=A0A1A9WS75_9MUSC